MVNPYGQANSNSEKKEPTKNFFSQLSSSAKKSGNKLKKMWEEGQNMIKKEEG